MVEALTIHDWFSLIITLVGFGSIIYYYITLKKVPEGMKIVKSQINYIFIGIFFVTLSYLYHTVVELSGIEESLSLVWHEIPQYTLTLTGFIFFILGTQKLSKVVKTYTF